MVGLVAILWGCAPASGDATRTAAATAQSTNADSAPVSAAVPDRPENTSVRPRVVLLGTSLTAGLGLDPSAAYPAVLERLADSAKLAVDIVNAGLSGETSAGALRRASWVLEQPADLVVLEVGANDGLRGVDPDSTYANLVALIDTVRRVRPTARIALVQMEAPPNLGARFTRRFHDSYVRAARETGVPLWPFLLEGVAGDARYNQADGIHPNREGAERVARTLWRSLAPAISSPVH